MVVNNYLSDTYYFLYEDINKILKRCNVKNYVIVRDLSTYDGDTPTFDSGQVPEKSHQGRIYRCWD